MSHSCHAQTSSHQRLHQPLVQASCLGFSYVEVLLAMMLMVLFLVPAMEADFCVFSGHKMLHAPPGAALLLAARAEARPEAGSGIAASRALLPRVPAGCRHRPGPPYVS